MLTDSKVAVDFLKQFHPDGPWVLTSIKPDRKGIDTDTFMPDTEAQAVEWLEKYSPTRNIYFSVNPTIEPTKKKASRENIKALAWLHVDLDPRAGEDPEEERARCLGLLQNPPKGVPAPTCIIFSGGGYQGFWKLEEPLPINGDEALYEDAKRYNQQLEVTFGGDNCHNVDRIMRMPGTINIPGPEKLKKGRTKTPTELLSMDLTLVYPLSDFTQAPVVQLPDAGISADAQRVEVSGNIERLGGVEELDKWNVPDRVRVAIVQGKDTDNPKKGDDSRSAWLFDVCCQLVRCQVPDDVIYSIITDPDFEISASVLAAGSNAKKYAVRQIQRAKDEAEDPWLRKLNDRHAVIRNLGGKCRIIEEQFDPVLNRDHLTKQTALDFMHGYVNIKVHIVVNEKDMYIPLGKYWFENKYRRQYDTLVFAPGRTVPGAYNLWKGFACEARAGDCSLYLGHALKVVCGGDEGHFSYLINWMARAVQKPDSPGQVAVVLRGEEGTGKGFLVSEFGKLWGRHFLQVSDPKHLVGSFNAHLRDCSVLFADEAFYAGDKKHESVLKQLITEKMIAIEMKGVDAEISPNYIHLLMASNNDWVVPAGSTARRFFVLDVTSDHRQDTTYFKTIADQMDNGGREALLYHLMNVDLSEFNVHDVPKTAGLQDQKIHSLDPQEEWWYNKLREGVLLEEDSWNGEVMKDMLFEDYTNYARDFNIHRRGTATSLGIFIKKICPEGWPKMSRKMIKVPVNGSQYPQLQNKRCPFYKFPSLEELRAHWVVTFGDTDWPKVEQVEFEEEPEIPF